MPGIVHSTYYLPPHTGQVADWCQRHGYTTEATQALCDSGARSYQAAAGETLYSMAGKALDQLLADAPAPAESVGALIWFHTNQSNALMPPQSMALQLARQGGLTRARPFSVSQQNCVSLLHSLRVLEALFASDPSLEHAIVIGADLILREDMRVIDASAIHSDAASALWISRQGGAAIRSIVTYNDPRFFRGASNQGVYEANDRYFWSAISVIRKAMQQAQIGPEQVCSLQPQNSNLPGWHKIAAALKLPVEKIYDANIARLGHAFGADAPINLQDSNALNTPGFHLLFSSGVAGCFGAAVIEVAAVE